MKWEFFSVRVRWVNKETKTKNVRQNIHCKIRRESKPAQREKGCGNKKKNKRTTKSYLIGCPVAHTQVIVLLSFIPAEILCCMLLPALLPYPGTPAGRFIKSSEFISGVLLDQEPIQSVCKGEAKLGRWLDEPLFLLHSLKVDWSDFLLPVQPGSCRSGLPAGAELHSCSSQWLIS